MNIGPVSRLTISARVLSTRWKPPPPATGCQAGVPSIGTRMAGVSLTMTRGGLLSTATAADFMPPAVNDRVSWSSERLRTPGAICFCSSAA